MAFGEIAKQLAQQALVDRVVSEPSETAQPDSVGAMMLREIQAMQNACKEDEELVVLFGAGADRIRVFDFIVPSWPVLVMAGIDESKTTTRVVSSAESVQLVCKVRKVQPPGKPHRVRFHIQKPKPEKK
jgi:hypothetical protein